MKKTKTKYVVQCECGKPVDITFTVEDLLRKQCKRLESKWNIKK